LTGEFYAAPLSRKDRNDLKLLRWLYPEPKPSLSQLDGDEFDMYRDHPFADELPAPDGNFRQVRPLGILLGRCRPEFGVPRIHRLRSKILH
jgi:hypothetical protein